MQPRIQLPAPVHAASLVLAVALSGCGSSDSNTSQQGPGAGGRLPSEFAVFVSDRTTTASDTLGAFQPYLYDFSTGEIRDLGQGLPADSTIPTRGAALSPNGQWLFATVGSYPNYSTHVIDLDRDSTRTLGLPAPGSRAQEGGNEPPAFSFSADSSRVIAAQASSGFPKIFTSNADGAGLQEVLLNQNTVERVGWLGSSNRFLVTGYDDAIEGRVLAIVEESGSLSAPMRLSNNIDTDIDAISVSADGSAVAALVVTFSPSGEETFEVVVLNLETSALAQFFVEGLEDGEVFMSDTGEYVAIYSEDPTSGDEQLHIGEVSTGGLEVATVPSSHGKSVDLDDDTVSWEPGGSRVAFVSAHRDDSADEITVASFGSTPLTIEPTVIPNSQVGELAWSPSGRFLVYVEDNLEVTLRVFDANSTAAPEIITDPTFSSFPRKITWAPDGEHLLVVELIVATGTLQTVAYSGSTFAPVGILGASFELNPISSSTPSSGFDPVAFSEDGRDLLWMPHQDSGNADELYSASFDSMGTPAENIVAEMPMGTMPPISQFWLRR